MAWNLDDLDEIEEQAKPVEEELAPQPIDAETFPAALAALVQEISAERYSLHGILQGVRYQLEVNYWVPTVANESIKGQLEQERNLLVDFLRKHTGNPTIKLRVEVDESIGSQDKPVRLTAEQKRIQMEKINPLLRELQQKFQTTTDY